MMINLAMATDRKYVRHLGALISSIVNNNQDNDLTIHVLNNDLLKQDKQKLQSICNDKTNIRFIEINQSRYSGLLLTRHTVNMYYRLSLPELLKDLDKILYLDCDVIVLDSLQTLYNTDLDGYVAAGVLDSLSVLSIGRRGKYYNSGVLLMNLEEMRKRKFESAIIEWIKNNPTAKYPDQDAINSEFGELIKEIDLKWNFQFPLFTEKLGVEVDPTILHYTTMNKPWNLWPKYELKKYYWKYLRMTPWKYTLPQQLSIKGIFKLLIKH